MNELSALDGSERYVACEDEGGDGVGDAETEKIQADKVHGEGFLLQQGLRRLRRGLRAEPLPHQGDVGGKAL